MSKLSTRLPTLDAVKVDKQGRVFVHLGPKVLQVLPEPTHVSESRYMQVLSYLDFAHNVHYYHYDGETLTLQFTKSNGKTEAWTYHRNKSDGIKFMGRRLDDGAFMELVNQHNVVNTP